MNKILKRNILTLIFALRKKEYSLVVLSVIATEMMFRNKLHRVFEYFYWVYLYLIRSKKITHLSVGIAQIKLHNWKTLGFISSYKPSLRHLTVIISSKHNYDACLKYLNYSLPSYERNNLYSVATVYTGRLRLHHFTVLQVAYKKANELIPNK